jgi:hypothetical protein
LCTKAAISSVAIVRGILFFDMVYSSAPDKDVVSTADVFSLKRSRHRPHRVGWR